ncbi:MAG: hypothetical protein V2I25_13675 [Woeseiaceae bacterium]|jgi:hypothetical protein|nr:hypothetical protein [Woeseiaceae bacterium]
MKILQNMATSIAFPLTAMVITTVLWAVSMTGYELVPGHSVENWFAQGTFTASYALLAGFLVDTVRWLTAVAWRPARPGNIVLERNRRSADPCLVD